MTDDTVSHLPQPGVVLDLDTAEREDVKPPYVVRVGGQDITFQDPADVNWEDLADIGHPNDLLRFALSKEDRQHLHRQKLPTWKFEKLLNGYYTHYDLEDKIREAKRQASLLS